MYPFLWDSASFVQLTVTWLCVGVYLYAYRLEFMLHVPQDAADVCVCVHVGVCGSIVSFCKLERHVAGWNPIRVYSQHVAVLTWYACYSNLVVKNRLSLGYFSGEYAVLKPPWFLNPSPPMLSCNYFHCLFVFSSLLHRRESWCQRSWMVRCCWCNYDANTW